MSQGRTYRIASFHITDLSRTTSTYYRATQIADILRHEDVDLAALQGVRDEEALVPILGSLGRNWSASWLLSRPRKGVRDVDHDPRGDGYAFLWDRRRFRLLDTRLLDGTSQTTEPSVYQRYHIDKEKGQQELVTDPVMGRFTASGLGGGNFELRLICDRIRYNGLDDIKDRRYWPLRQNEFEVLAGTILPHEEDMVYGAQMPAYTLILGDYNLNLRREWTKKPFLETPPDGLRIKEKRILTVQDQLTTVKRPKDGKSQEPTVGYANNYDHFTYNINRMEKLRPVERRVDVIGNGYYQNYFGNYDRYREEISEHLPIILTIQP